MFSDRILTFIGIKYQDGGEANPIMSRLFDYFGVIPASIGSYLFTNVFLYLFSSRIHKRIGLKNGEMLGSMYLGVGGAESLVSLHNYLIMNNYNDFIAKMSYGQSLLPLSFIVSAPLIYYFIKTHRKSKTD